MEPSDPAALDPDAFARAVAPALGLVLAPHHRPGVAMNLALAARMAALVGQWPLTPSDEAAPVFVAARPGADRR